MIKSTNSIFRKCEAGKVVPFFQEETHFEYLNRNGDSLVVKILAKCHILFDVQ